MMLNINKGLIALCIASSILMACITAATQNLAWVIVGGIVICPVLAVAQLIIENRESK